MKVRFKRLFLLTSIIFLLTACSSTKRMCELSYYYMDSDKTSIVDELFTENTYYLFVTFNISDENSENYKFTTYINVNDSNLVTYMSGSKESCLLDKNFLEVSYSGNDSILNAVYKIDTKSNGITYLQIKNNENITFNLNKLKINVKEN